MECKPGHNTIILHNDKSHKLYVLVGEEGSVVVYPAGHPPPAFIIHLPLNERETVEKGNEACDFILGRDCKWHEVRSPDLTGHDEESIRALLMEVYQDEVLGYWARVRQEPVYVAGVE